MVTSRGAAWPGRLRRMEDAAVAADANHVGWVRLTATTDHSGRWSGSGPFRSPPKRPAHFTQWHGPRLSRLDAHARRTQSGWFRTLLAGRLRPLGARRGRLPRLLADIRSPLENRSGSA